MRVHIINIGASRSTSGPCFQLRDVETSQIRVEGLVELVFNPLHAILAFSSLE